MNGMSIIEVFLFVVSLGAFLAIMLWPDPMAKAKIEEEIARRIALEHRRELSFRDEVLEQAIVAHVYQEAHETDPKGALQDILSWHCAVALDPVVSSDARALVAQGEAAAFDRVAAMVSSGENSDQWTWQRDMTLISVLREMDAERFRAWFNGAAVMQAKPGRIETIAAASASNRAHHVAPGPA